MSDKGKAKDSAKPLASAALGDIIGATRQRLEQPAGAPQDPAERLRSLVAATTAGAPSRGGEPSPAPVEPGAVLPVNYFPQVPASAQPGAVSGAPSAIIPKRKPQRGPSRSLHISMRLSPPERDRLVQWCDERNLSLPDGVMALLDIADKA